MAERFINDDVKLRKGGRKAPRISQDNLRDIIIREAQRIDKEEFEYAVKERKGDAAKELLIATYILTGNEGYFEKDNKFQLGWDNFSFKSSEYFSADHLCGLHTLNNGFTFLGFETAGDEQMPAFGVMYHDGKQLRVYFPTYGNYVNLDFKCALGSEWDDEQARKAEKLYRKLGIWDEANPELFPYHTPRWDALYCAKYGLNVYDCFNWKNINWKALREDIESRIEIIN